MKKEEIIEEISKLFNKYNGRDENTPVNSHFKFDVDKLLEEYKEEGKTLEVEKCNIRKGQLLMVRDDLEKVLLGDYTIKKDCKCTEPTEVGGGKCLNCGKISE